MLSSGAYVIIWEKMLSPGAYVTMVSSGANVMIWCYHVMLSSGMITHPFFIFLKTSLTPNNCTAIVEIYLMHVNQASCSLISAHKGAQS
jgi:hypothetical protein